MRHSNALSVLTPKTRAFPFFFFLPAAYIFEHLFVAYIHLLSFMIISFCFLSFIFIFCIFVHLLQLWPFWKAAAAALPSFGTSSSTCTVHGTAAAACPRMYARRRRHLLCVAARNNMAHQQPCGMPHYRTPYLRPCFNHVCNSIVWGARSVQRRRRTSLNVQAVHLLPHVQIIFVHLVI